MLRIKAKETGAANVSSSQLTQGQLNEAIKKKAQELYERSGRMPGRDLNNWLEAERVVKKQKRA